MSRSRKPDSPKEDSIPLLVLTNGKPVRRTSSSIRALQRDNGIASHQYEEIESEIWKHHLLQRKYGTRDHWWSHANKRVFRKWGQTLLIGCGTGLIAYVIISCTGKLTELKFKILYSLIEKERMGVLHMGASYLFFTLFNLLCVTVAWFTVFLAPQAAGSGIPEVKCFLNGLNVNVLELKTLVAKVLGIIFTVSGGLPAGKEGPMVHSGAALAVLLSQSSIMTKLFGVDSTFRRYQDFHNDSEKRDFVACGAAAGVAAAFGAPIGGVLFSLEEGASFWSTKLTWRAFFCAMATVTTLFIIRSVNIHLGQVNANAMFSFGHFYALQGSIYNFSAFELPVFAMIGAMGGLLGAFFNEANKHLHTYRMKTFISNIYARWREVLLVSFLMSSLSFWMPVLVPACTPRPFDMEDWSDQEKDLASKLVSLYCDSSEYSQLGSLFLTDSDTAIKQLFHFRELGNNAEPTFSSVSLGLFYTLYAILACVNYGTAVPSGMFVPSLLQGAAFGRLIGHLLHTVDNRKGTFADSGTFALVGAAAGLGGMARMTISLTVIILEATGDVQYVVPLMVTVMFARFVGNIYNEGLYDIHIHLTHTPFLEESDESDNFVDLSASDIMTKNLVCFPPIVTVGEVFDALQQRRHHCFPVTGRNEEGECTAVLLGTVARKVLCTLILHKAFGFSGSTSLTAGGYASPLVNWGALESRYPEYPDVDSLTVSLDEREGLLDLRPYMERGPHVIYSTASAMRAYRIFRTLGLRHLVVIDNANRAVGMITRMELLRSHMKECESGAPPWPKANTISPRHGGNDDTNYLDEECSTSSHSFASGASNVETSITLDGLHMMDDVY